LRGGTRQGGSRTSHSSGLVWAKTEDFGASGKLV